MAMNVALSNTTCRLGLTVIPRHIRTISVAFVWLVEIFRPIWWKQSLDAVSSYIQVESNLFFSSLLHVDIHITFIIIYFLPWGLGVPLSLLVVRLSKEVLGIWGHVIWSGTYSAYQRFFFLILCFLTFRIFPFWEADMSLWNLKYNFDFCEYWFLLFISYIHTLLEGNILSACH